jgi:hypothetical protein
MSMHNGIETTKLINACQAKSINVYKNMKTQLMKCCANIYFNKQCLKLHVIPKYAQIKFPRSSPTSISTQQKTQVMRIKDEIRFLYRKKQQLNLELYRAHLKASTEWGSMWDTISKHIHTSTNKYISHKYHNIDIQLDSLLQQKHTKNQSIPIPPQVSQQDRHITK